MRLLILAAVALSGLAPPPQAGQPTFRSGVEVVHIDVTVVDKKQRPLRGLKATDFVVLQDGRPRPVVSFQDISTERTATRSGRATTVRAASDAAGPPRAVTILFDRTIAPGAPAVAARRFAAATIDQLADGDWVSVVDLVNRQALPFSRDRAAAALAIGHAATTPMNTTDENATERSERFCGVCTLDLLTRIATAQGEMPNTRRLILYVGASIGTVPDNGSTCEPYLRPARNAMFRAAQDAGVTIHAIDPNALKTFSPAGEERLAAVNVLRWQQLGGRMVLTGHVLVAVILTLSQAPQVPASKPDLAVREQRIAALRAAAQDQIDQERTIYSQQELDDIATRWQAAHQPAPYDVFLRRDAAPLLSQLIADYPKSNRAGCAMLHLARQAPGEERERELKRTIKDFSGAWCENGVQVGALARALLAVHCIGLDKYDEAERWAKQVVQLFPGAVDDSGAPLDDLLTGIQLLRKH